MLDLAGRPTGRLLDSCVRNAELSRAHQAVEAGRCVILAGEYGMGKTYLVAALESRLGRDAPLLPVRGTVARRHMPWGAMLLALGLPPDHAADIGRAFREATPGEGTPVVLVDDVHLLDDDTTDWLSRLAHEGEIRVVCALEPLASDAPSTNRRAVQAFTGLWADGVADRIDLAPLDSEQSEELILQLVREEQIDAGTRSFLRQRSSGSPLLLRELTLDGIASGFVAPPQWNVLPYRLSPPPARVVDLLRARVAPLSAAAREALMLFAKLDGTEYDRAAAFVGESVLSVLLHRGHLQAGSDGRLRARRIDAEILLATGAVQDSGTTIVDVARRILADQQHGVVVPPLEAMLVAEVVTESRPDLFGVFRRDYGDNRLRNLLLLAAQKANTSGSHQRALTFADAAGRIARSTDTQVQVSRALTGLGDDTAASAVLEELTAATAEHTERFLYLWSATAASAGRVPTMLRRLDAVTDRPTPELETELRVVRIAGAFAAMQWDARADALALARDASASTVNRFRATSYLAVLAAFAGDGQGVRAAKDLYDSLRNRPDDAVAADALLVRENRVAACAALGVAASATWIGVDEATRDLVAVIDDVLDGQDAALLSLLGTAGGLLAAARGDSAMAAQEFRFAALRYRGPGAKGWRAWLAGQESQALARTGRYAEARAAMVVAEQGEHPAAWITFALGRARIELLAGEGRRDAARVRSFALARLYRASPVLATRALFRSYTLGAPASLVLGAFESLGIESDLESIELRHAALVAAAAEDGSALHETAQALAALGMLEQAEATAEHALRIFEADGARRSAVGARSTLADVRGFRGAEAAGMSGVVLTPREHEIAVLAARGMSNREIAAELYLSIRTVESHVYQALAKLGVRSRRDLPDALRRP